MRPVSEQWAVTQGFASLATAGVRGDYNGSQVQVLVAMYGNYQPDGHAGGDIGCPVGTPVRAARSGTVVLCDWDVNLPGDDSWSSSGYFQRFAFYKRFGGRLLVIQHAPGDLDVYAHLSAWKVRKGQFVNEGDLVALSGDSSAGQDGVLGPHLHTERIVDLSYSTGNGLIYGRTDPSTVWGGLAAQGSIQASEEDDMFTDDDRAKLVMALDKANRAAEVGNAMEDGGLRAQVSLSLQLLQHLDASFRYLKAPGNDTLWELEGGKLRGITLAEWTAAGGTEPREVAQKTIDDLPKVA